MRAANGLRIAGRGWRSVRPVITGLSLLLPPAAPASHDPCIGYDTAGFTGPDGEAGDGFGISLAVSGDIAVIGAAHDDDGGVDSGSAWVFRLTEAGWCPEQKLLPPDGADHDWFGLAVAVSGDRALVGAFGNDDNGPDSGSAYVFHYEGIRWSRQCWVVASDGAANDRFGYAVAMHGDVALVGAFGDDEGGSESGSAYVFRLDGAEWVEEAKLRPSHGEAEDRFGRSVAIWGDTALIGLPQRWSGGIGAGCVFIYDGSNWIEQGRLLPSDGEPYDGYACSVCISGDQGVIGAPEWDYHPGGVPGRLVGAMYVFDYLSDCNDNGVLDACDIDDGVLHDADNDGVPDECECPGDIDGDGDTDHSDLGELLAAWCTQEGDPNWNPNADLDGDGHVGHGDLGILLADWGCGV